MIWLYILLIAWGVLLAFSTNGFERTSSWAVPVIVTAIACIGIGVFAAIDETVRLYS